MSGFPEQGLTSGEVRETSGEVRGTSGEVWETSGEPLDSCKVPQRTSGEVAEKLPGKLGELPEKSGNFPEARGSPTPSQRLAKFVSKSLLGAFFSTVLRAAHFPLQVCFFELEMLSSRFPADGGDQFVERFDKGRQKTIN